MDDDGAPPNATTDGPFGGTALATPTASSYGVPDSSASTRGPLASSSSSGRYFPFSSALSMRYCLESAGVILQTLPDLPQVHMAGAGSKFYSFTPFACPIILAGYTFLMLRQKIENCASPVELENGSRSLLDECERGAASCMEVLDGFAQAWMHLEDAASELMNSSFTRSPLFHTMWLLIPVVVHMKEAAKYL